MTVQMKSQAGTSSRRAAGFLVADQPSGLPRAYTDECVRYEVDFDSALKAITASTFRPRTEAILTASEPELISRVAALSAACESEPRSLRRATITSFANEEVAIDVTCPSACLLVLTDLFYPGWTATVDGEPAPILRTNALFRGLILEPGPHRVVQRFQSSPFRIGLALCATAALASLLLVLIPRDRFRYPF